MPRSILLHMMHCRLLNLNLISLSKYIHVHCIHICVVHVLGFHNLDNNIFVLCNFMYTYIINEIQIPILKSEEKLFCDDVFS